MLSITIKSVGKSQEGRGPNCKVFNDFDIEIDEYSCTPFSISVPLNGGPWRYSKTFLSNLSASEQEEVIERLSQLI